MTTNCSNDVPQKPHRDLPIEVTVRELINLRNKHGADSPIGHRCSNLIELIQMPELATWLTQRQMADLARLMSDHQ